MQRGAAEMSSLYLTRHPMYLASVGHGEFSHREPLCSPRVVGTVSNGVPLD